MRRYALRDDEWERIKDILPGRKGSVGAPAKNNRLFVEAVLYRYRAGIAWRDLPVSMVIENSRLLVTENSPPWVKNYLY